MSKIKTYQPTLEQLEKWKEVDELEPSASAGILSQEEQNKNVQELLDPNYLQNQLDELHDYKQKLLKKLSWVEQREQLLIEEIQREARNKP